jgi:hypothetical protein
VIEPITGGEVPPMAGFIPPLPHLTGEKKIRPNFRMSGISTFRYLMALVVSLFVFGSVAVRSAQASSIFCL